MAAQTGKRDAQVKEPGHLIDLPVAASTTIYEGALVGINSTGGVRPMAHGVANLIFAGIATETVANSGALGAKTCKVLTRGTALVTSGSGTFSAASVGNTLFATTDNEAQAVTTSLTYHYPVGRVVEVVSTTVARIWFSDFALVRGIGVLTPTISTNAFSVSLQEFLQNQLIVVGTNGAGVAGAIVGIPGQMILVDNNSGQTVTLNSGPTLATGKVGLYAFDAGGVIKEVYEEA